MLKHVGRMTQNKRKVVVAYKVVPGEPDHCVVVTTENLEAADHDSLIKLVESDSGQNEEDLATAMMRTRLPDGRNMLASFHKTGKMVKVETKEVEMVPNSNTRILLSELNEVIAQQRGVTVADLAPKDAQGNTVQPAKEATERTLTAEEVAAGSSNTAAGDVLTDEALAAKYRSQADALYKEAKALRAQAEELVPTIKKKTAKTKTEESA